MDELPWVGGIDDDDDDDAYFTFSMSFSTFTAKDSVARKSEIR